MMSGRKTQQEVSPLVKNRAEVNPRADAYHVAELFFHFIKANLLQICCAVRGKYSLHSSER